MALSGSESQATHCSGAEGTTLVALGRSSGPGIGNRGRSVTSRSSPSPSGEHITWAHVPLVIPSGAFHFKAQKPRAPNCDKRRAFVGSDHPENHGEEASCSTPPWLGSAGGPTGDSGCRPLIPACHMRPTKHVAILPQRFPRASMRGTYTLH